MSEERTWLTHPPTGGFFHCPAAAVDDWQALGWEPCDAPPEPPNPAVLERIAWEREHAGELIADDGLETAEQPDPAAVTSANDESEETFSG